MTRRVTIRVGAGTWSCHEEVGECGLAPWSVLAHVAEHEGPMAVAPLRDHGWRVYVAGDVGGPAASATLHGDDTEDGRATLSL